MAEMSDAELVAKIREIVTPDLGFGSARNGGPTPPEIRMVAQVQELLGVSPVVVLVSGGGDAPGATGRGGSLRL